MALEKRSPVPNRSWEALEIVWQGWIIKETENLLAQQEIEQNFIIFQKLVGQANSYFKSENYKAAAAYTEIAAAYATHRHSGIFVSHQLERILHTIGNKISIESNSDNVNLREHDHRRHILHVITEAMGISGHTRMVWRWIQQDIQSCHSVVLTRQHEKIPKLLINAVQASGGRIYRLNDRLGNVLSWAADLRRIAVSFDLIVLHIFTFDVIPQIAFANKASMPPIILLNMIDHQFWLGNSISDIIANQRYSGSRLSQTRRGVDPSRFGFLPIILPPISRKVSREEAKKRVGLSEDTILLLSIARHTKYMPFRDNGSKFNELVLPYSVLSILERYPNSVLLVIGPEFNDQWVQASQSVQGRILALGKRADTEIFYQAADIYLDSFPFGSNTSCLEAGSYELPLVSCNPYSDEASVLVADTPALENTMLRVKNSLEFISAISHLIEDPQYRLCIGANTRKSILSVHVGENWMRYLYKLYSQAENPPVIAMVEGKDQPMLISELDILLLDADKLVVTEHRVAQDHMRLLPLDVRINYWLQLFTKHHLFKPSLLLSEWLAVQLKKEREIISGFKLRRSKS